MTHSQGRSAQHGIDAAQLWLIIMVILAFIASIIMLISGSGTALRLALLSALWAAALGFLLVNRYKKTADATRVQLTEQRKRARSDAERLEAEFEAERLRIEHELRSSLEMEYQKRHADDVAALRAIRREVSRLRATLEAMGAGDFGLSDALQEVESKTVLEIESRHSAARQSSDHPTDTRQSDLRQNATPDREARVTDTRQNQGATRQNQGRRSEAPQSQSTVDTDAFAAIRKFDSSQHSTSTQRSDPASPSGTSFASSFGVSSTSASKGHSTSTSESPSRASSASSPSFRDYRSGGTSNTSPLDTTPISDAVFTRWTPSSSAFKLRGNVAASINEEAASSKDDSATTNFGTSFPSASESSSTSSAGTSFTSPYTTPSTDSFTFSTDTTFGSTGTTFGSSPDSFSTTSSESYSSSSVGDWFSTSGTDHLTGSSTALNKQDEDSEFSKMWDNAAKEPARSDVHVEQVPTEPVRKHRRPESTQLRKSDPDDAPRGRRRRDEKSSGVSVEELMRRGKKF